MEDNPRPSPPRQRYLPAIGPRLRKLLVFLLALFTLLIVNSVYLSCMTFAEWWTDLGIKDRFYLWMVLVHVLFGLVMAIPMVVFGIVHIRNARNRPNRRAVRVGYALFGACLLLIVTGFLLLRVEGFIDIRGETARRVFYWLHFAAPLVAVWLFVLHRLAGKRIKWKVGLGFAGLAAAFALVLVLWQAHDSKPRNVVGPKSGELYFFPSLARTSEGNFISADTMLMNDYCQKCHADAHKAWSHSAHRMSSFNNPAYLFSVKGTRRAMKERDGNTQGSRFCAGCHDPVPFFSGSFDDPKFDDPDYDLANDQYAQAGITCTVCHSITAINSVKGNGAYTIEEPVHYPFAFSKNPFLQWVNNQLVKAKPELHKRTFLKPLHKTPEFCSTCHKVHLPEELNAYKWLRGQNHYDAYHLSGVSGHGVASWYYPPKATHDCVEGCHMPLEESNDFGAKLRDGVTKIHNHMFPSANTALPFLLGMPDSVIESHKNFNKGVMRLDIFALKEGGHIDAPVLGPIRPVVPELKPGTDYIVEIVLRTVKMGHLFTQGTADSNEVWVDTVVKCGDRMIGRSGGMAKNGEVDPWSHFVNAYVLDRKGNRIDRRNAEDIFIPLYNHQIPPGAADVVHFSFTVPEDAQGPITIESTLRYRKFDTKYMQYVYGEAYQNNLPVMDLASDRVSFPLAGGSAQVSNANSPIDPWQRWNDYGIGLFLKGTEGSSKGELKQAEQAFWEVEKLGRPDGPLNRARVYIKEGRLEEAVDALKLAAEKKASPWSVTWFTGQVNMQNGNLDEAIENFRAILANAFEGVKEREFDFSQDYTVLNALGRALFERAKREPQEPGHSARVIYLEEAVQQFLRALDFDPENVTAHYNLALLYEELGDSERSGEHAKLHLKYKPDDNARDFAIQTQRMANPAANFAAESVVIYNLQRPGAYELPATEARAQGSH